METIKKVVSFIVGVILVVFGIIDECPRIGTIAVGLLLMGVFTISEALEVIKGRSE